MRRMVVIFVGIALLGSVASAKAAPFFNPPEDVLGDNWHVPFPYQRNVLLDFSADHTIPDPYGGINGADYEGMLDPVLKYSDFVLYDNIMVGEAGALAPGYTSPSGTPVVKQLDPAYAGLIEIHLDNTPEPWFKEMWIEYVTNSPAGGVPPMIVPETGMVTTYEVVAVEKITDIPGYDWYVTKVWVQIVPNPVSEEVTFEVPKNASLPPYLIDSIHIATNCIPEPSTLLIWSLLGAGGVGLGVCRRRRSGRWIGGGVPRAPWSEENRQAIRQIIARGGPL